MQMILGHMVNAVGHIHRSNSTESRWGMSEDKREKTSARPGLLGSSQDYSKN